MPTLSAVVPGMAVSWVVQSAVGPYVTVRVRAATTLVVFSGVAYATRRLLLRLRNGNLG